MEAMKKVAVSHDMFLVWCMIFLAVIYLPAVKIGLVVAFLFLFSIVAYLIVPIIICVCVKCYKSGFGRRMRRRQPVPPWAPAITTNRPMPVIATSAPALTTTTDREVCLQSQHMQYNPHKTVNFNENELPQVEFEPTTICVYTRQMLLPTKLLRQLSYCIRP